jgi:hypothetical protein
MSREDQAALDQELKLRLEEWGRSLRADAAELVVSFLDLDESERGRLLVQVLQAPAGWNLR